MQISHQAQAGVGGTARLGGEGAPYSALGERRSIPPRWPELRRACWWQLAEGVCTIARSCWKAGGRGIARARAPGC